METCFKSVLLEIKGKMGWKESILESVYVIMYLKDEVIGNMIFFRLIKWLPKIELKRSRTEMLRFNTSIALLIFHRMK